MNTANPATATSPSAKKPPANIAPIINGDKKERSHSLPPKKRAHPWWMMSKAPQPQPSNAPSSKPADEPNPKKSNDKIAAAPMNGGDESSKNHTKGEKKGDNEAPVAKAEVSPKAPPNAQPSPTPIAKPTDGAPDTTAVALPVISNKHHEVRDDASGKVWTAKDIILAPGSVPFVPPSKASPIDSIAGQIQSIMPRQVTTSSNNDHTLSSDESDDDEPSFNVRTAVKRPRNSGAAEAYARRMKEREEEKSTLKGEKEGEKKDMRDMSLDELAVESTASREEEERKKKDGGLDGETTTPTSFSEDDEKKPAAIASPAKDKVKSGGNKRGGGKAKGKAEEDKQGDKKGHAKVKRTSKVPDDLPPDNRKSSTRLAVAASLKSDIGSVGSLKSPPEEIASSATTNNNGSKKSSKKKEQPSSPPISASEQPCPDIGEGWTVQIVPRKSGKWADRYYFSPGGRNRFRSLPEVERYLKRTEEGKGEIIPDEVISSPPSSKKKAAKKKAPVPDEITSSPAKKKKAPKEEKSGRRRSKKRSNAAVAKELLSHLDEPPSMDDEDKKPAASRTSPRGAVPRAIAGRLKGYTDDFLGNDDGGDGEGGSKRRSKRVKTDDSVKSSSPSPSAKKKKKSSSSAFKVGDRIEAKYHGKGRRYYPGEIVGVHSDESQYDVDYDDGDEDRGLSGRHVRKLSGEIELVDVLVSDGSFEEQEEEVVAEPASPVARGGRKRKAPEEEADEDVKPAAKPAAKRAKKPKKKPRSTDYLEVKKNNTWNERVALLKAHKAKYKSCHLSACPKSERDPNLRNFVFETRKQYKKFQRGEHSTLTAEKITQLEKMGFDFTPMESGTALDNREKNFMKIWNEKFKELEKYKKERGNCLVSTVDGEYNQLANWVRGQRKLMNKVGREGFPAERLAKLEKIGFDFDPTHSKAAFAKRRQDMFPKVDAKWEEHYQDLVKYKKQNGDVLIGPNSGEEWPGLYNWIHCQRKEYKRWEEGDEKALMYDKWIAKMNELGFDWAPQMRASERASKGFTQPPTKRESKHYDAMWQRGYETLKKFKKKNGHCYVSRVGADEYLAGWIHVQRKHKRNVEKGKDTPLTPERIRLLDDIGLDWNPSQTGGMLKAGVYRDKDWEGVYIRLCSFKKRHGHANPKKKEPVLGHWARRMRKLYAQNAKGETTSLTEARVAKLESIGFDFCLGSEGTTTDL